MQLLLNKRMKHHWVQNAAYYNKLRALLRRVFPNYIIFTMSLIVLVENMNLLFDQMEPSRSMQTRSGNPVRTPKMERDFPDF